MTPLCFAFVDPLAFATLYGRSRAVQFVRVRGRRVPSGVHLAARGHPCFTLGAEYYTRDPMWLAYLARFVPAVAAGAPALIEPDDSRPWVVPLGLTPRPEYLA